MISPVLLLVLAIVLLMPSKLLSNSPYSIDNTIETPTAEPMRILARMGSRTMARAFRTQWARIWPGSESA